MDQTKVVNFTNVRNSHRVAFLHGQMQSLKTHRMADLEPMAHQHLEVVSRAQIVITVIIQQAKQVRKINFNSLVPEVGPKAE